MSGRRVVVCDAATLAAGIGAGGGGGTTLPVGTADGQMLFWDQDTQTYVLTAAPADEDVFVFEASTGLVVPRPPSIWLAFGANGVITAGSPSFLWPYNENATTQATEAAAGTAPLLDAGVLKRIVVIHAVASGATSIPYVAVLNGGATALTVSLSSGTANTPVGAAVDVAVAAASRLTVSAQQASGGTLTIRPLVLVQFQPN